MSSRREDIVLALISALTTPPAGITKPAGATIHRFSQLPIEQDKLPAILVYWTECIPTEKGWMVAEPDTDRLFEYHLTLRVECRISGEPVDSLLDPLCQYVRQVVFSDPSFGGLARATKEDGIKIDAITADRVYAGAAVDFTVSYYEEPWTKAEDVSGVLVHASYPTSPTEMTLEVIKP